MLILSKGFSFAEALILFITNFRTMIFRSILGMALSSLFYPSNTNAQDYLIPPIHKACLAHQNDMVKASECTQIELMKEISQHLVYPQQAIDQSIEGRVFISFIVNEDGTINEKSVGLANTNSSNTLLAQEAIRVVKLLQPLHPAMLDNAGTTTSAKYILPVRFNLEKTRSIKDKERKNR